MHACVHFRIWISRRVKIQLVVPVLQNTAVLLTAVLATISTNTMAQIVTSADSAGSTSGNRFVSWLHTIRGRESAQSQERAFITSYHKDESFGGA